MRMKTIIAGITALAMSALVSAEPAGIYHENLVSATVKDDVAIAMPDWVPRDYSSAVDFLNEYGTSHAEGNFVCLVYRGFSETTFSNTPLYTTTFEGTNPDYEFYYGQPKCYMALFKYDDNNKEIQASIDKTEYSFTMTENGYEETDIYSWLPDSWTEYCEMRVKYGNMFIRDGKIVFIKETSGPAGYSWITLSGDKMLRKERYSGCDTVYEGLPPIGGPSYGVEIMTPESDGFIDLHMVHAKGWEIEESKTEEIHKYFMVRNNCQDIEELSENPSELSNVVYGYAEYSTISDARYLNYEGLKDAEDTAVITSREELEKFAAGFMNDKGVEDLLGKFDEKLLENNVLLLKVCINEGGPDSAAPFSVNYDGDKINVKYYIDSWDVCDTAFLDVMSVYIPKEYYTGQETVWDVVRAGRRGYARFSVVDYDTGELIPSGILRKDYRLLFRTSVYTKHGNTGPLVMLSGENMIYKEDFGALCLSPDTEYYGIEVASSEDAVPEGYRIPEDSLEISEFRCNNSLDVKLRLKKETPDEKGETEPAPGDINGNGIVDITDLTELSLILVDNMMMTDAQKTAADVDHDGAVKLTDLAVLRQFLSKQIEKL